MEHFKAITFTHASVGLEQVAKLFIAEDDYEHRFNGVHNRTGVEEFMFLATCNRVEYYFTAEQTLNNQFMRQFFSELYPDFSEEEITWAVENGQVSDGIDAVRHMFHVASSLDSLVVGEREIITQFRKAYDKCHSLGLTGDFIRIAKRKTIETAKQVFTETEIANRPVSVVNLANKHLVDQNLPFDARLLVVGAGVTNTAMLLRLRKQGYTNFTIFNRTIEKAEKLARQVGGRAMSLEDLATYNEGFDALITCTGAPGSIIDADLYHALLAGENSRKVVVDLAVPTDLDSTVLLNNSIEYVAVEGLKAVAEKNMAARKKHMVKCEAIVDVNLQEFEGLFQERQVELAMKDVPKSIRAIRDRALNDVFANRIQEMNDSERETLEEILAYFEKKYISLPYRMAKDIIINKRVETLGNSK